MKKWCRFYSIGLLFFIFLPSFSQNRVFLNGGFETPVIDSGNFYNYYISADAPNSVVGRRMDAWSTSAPDYLIELRQFMPNKKTEPSAVGIQHAEINANHSGNHMYQDVCLINGETIHYSFYHRGRLGPDTLQVNLYDVSGTNKVAIAKTVGDDTLAWKSYSGSYNVSIPSGNYQLSFESLFSFGNNPFSGNLIDEINITMAPLITFSQPSYSAKEGSLTVPSIKVNGIVPAGGLVVSLSASPIGATLGTDYTFANIVTIPQGNYTPQSDSFPIAFNVLNDGIMENNEKILFTILSATNGGIVNTGCGGFVSTEYTILNDDLFEAGPNQAVCPGDSIQLSATGGESPTWDNTVKQGIPFAVPKVPGTYLFIAKDTSYSEPIAGVPFFLPMSDTVLVTVKPAPFPLTKDIDTCQQANLLTLSAIGGTQFLWYTDTLGAGSHSPPVIDLNIPDTINRWVSQVTNGCESKKMEITVAVKAKPVAALVQDTVLCQTVGTFAFKASGTHLLWYSTGSTIGNSLTPTINTHLPQITTYYVTQTVNGCEGPKAKETITVLPLPLAPFGTDQVICESMGNIGYLASGSSLKWYASPTSTVFSTLSPTINRSTVGVFLAYVSQNTTCESPRTEVKITILPLPLPPNVTNVQYCLHDTGKALTTLTDSLFWYNISVGGTRSSIIPVANTQSVGTTTYWVSAVKNGCEGLRSSVQVTTNALPNVKISGISPGSYCSKSSLALLATGAIQYSWQIPSGNLSSLSKLSIPSFSTSDTGIYVLKGTDSNVCSAKDSLQLSLKNPPTVSANPVNVCEKSTIMITAQTTGTAYWKLPNHALQNSITLYIPISKYSDNGKYWVVSTQNGCTDSSSVMITVSNCPPVAKDDHFTIFSDETLRVNASNHPILNDSDPNDSLVTEDFSFLSTPRYGKLIIDPSGFWTYMTNGEVEATEVLEYQICDKGVPILCATAKIEIELKKRDAFFPDAFTPNGDGVNDSYVVYNLAPNLRVDLSVFNRWGDLVYQNTDYKNEWKGACTATMCLGTELPAGTYYVVAQLSNGYKHTTYLTLSR